MESDENNATISFIRKGYLKMFFKTEGDTTEALTFMDAISYIKSKPEEAITYIGEDYYNQLDKNKQAFDEKLSEEVEIHVEKYGVTGNDAKMIKLLKALARCKKLTDVQDDLLLKMINLREDGEIPQSLTKEILNKSVRR